MDENESLEIPDFSDPEFENDKDVKKWREQAKEFEKYMDDCVKIVTDTFNASISAHKNLKRFELHRLINKPFIVNSYTGGFGNEKVFFSVIQYHTSTSTVRGNSSGEDYYFVGVANLERSYPHTLIQKETAALKIHNLFVRGDVDFKHARKFSSKFHVVTKDEERLRKLVELVDLDKLVEFDNAEIEIKDNECYFRADRKPVSKEEAQIFTDLAKTICKLF